jgi:hypothetical protein
LGNEWASSLASSHGARIQVSVSSFVSSNRTGRAGPELMRARMLPLNHRI